MSDWDFLYDMRDEGYSPEEIADAAACGYSPEQGEALEEKEELEEEALLESERVNAAEKQVHICLNYGGVFHDGGPTSKELELAYAQGDLADEVPQMRLLAAALNELADALEEDE